MTRRVLQIIPTLDRGGAEKQLTLLAGRLPRDEFEVHVCVLTRSGPLAAELSSQGVPLTVVGKTWKVDPAAWWRLRRLIGRLAPQLVQTWLFAANSYGRSAARAAGVRRLVAGERCVDRWKSSAHLALDRYLARSTQRIVANSPGVRDFYVGKGLPAEKFTIIPNGIVPSEGTAPLERGALLAELGLPAETRLIGAVGRLWPQKRIKDLIWAADLLKVARDDVHLLIIGEGPDRWRLERFRDQVRICDRVHFLGERADVPRLLPHLDCVWLASGYEGQPNAIMEAMLAGIPVVATDIPGNRDLVVPGETGYLVPVGNRAGFARHTYQLLDDPATARRLGAASRARMLAQFHVDTMVGRYVELYRQLLE